MKQLISLTVVFASCFLISCQKEVRKTQGSDAERSMLASKVNKTNAEKSVPFKGDYVTTAQFFSGPPILIERITGNGNATHIGNSTFVVDATLDVSTQPPFVITGTGVFTAANGDQFYTQVAGSVTPSGPGMQRGEINHTIVGGTGRFEDATGTFTGSAIINLATPTNTVTFEGTINY